MKGNQGLSVSSTKMVIDLINWREVSKDTLKQLCNQFKDPFEGEACGKYINQRQNEYSVEFLLPLEVAAEHGGKTCLLSKQERPSRP